MTTGTPVTADTPAGRIRGRRRGGVSAFLGVPYGGPTGGTARFAPPTAPAPWRGERDAGRWGPWAPQWQRPLSHPSDLFAAILPGYGAPRATSEDCLTCNVWTPATPGRDAGRRPVLVWLHGGGFETGGPSYGGRSDGAAMARSNDVVVVSVTHRLGVLGFLDLSPLGGPDVAASGTAGLDDLIFALRWVQESIGAFGGDPRRVTVFGESGGAMKVLALLAAPSAAGLFHRAICQSATVTNGWTAEDAGRRRDAVLRELGISGGDRVAQLRARSPDELVAADARLAHPADGLGPPAYAPLVGRRGLPGPPQELVAGGARPEVPLLIGTNRDEWRLYLAAQPGFTSLDFDDVTARLRPPLGERAAEVVAAYRAAEPSAEACDVFVAIESDRLFRLPADRLAERRAAAGAPVFTYLFSWCSPLLPEVGACHGLETPLVFANPDACRATAGQASARRLSDVVSGAWCRFARDGAPGHPGLPPWPVYEPGRRATMVLDAAPRVVDDPLAVLRAAWGDAG